MYQGADSFINGGLRYCLWIDDKNVNLAYSIPPIKERLEKVMAFRLASKAESTRLYANRPYLFKQRAHIDTDSIIVPSVSSENVDICQLECWMKILLFQMLHRQYIMQICLF